MRLVAATAKPIGYGLRLQIHTVMRLDSYPRVCHMTVLTASNLCGHATCFFEHKA